MRLADLVDVEAQLARDREADPSALEARDRALAPGADPRRPHAALSRWVAALRAAPGAALPGRAVARALRVLRAVLVAAGLAVGWGAAAALTRFEGPHPVNVWDWLLAFVGVQLALLALLLASLVPAVRALGLPLLGAVRGALGALILRLSAGGRGGGWAELAHRLRARRSLYRGVEPWLLVGLVQSFAVAFNVGVLLATVRQVVFSDVAFAWSTTLLRLDTDAFHALVRGLAAPWAWLWPDAVPSRALVAATRYSHLEGAYFEAGAGRAADPALVGAWWPFLVAAVTAYGLLPRAAMLAIARARAAWLLARLPLDDAEVQSLLRRIAAPAVRTGAASAEAPAPADPPALAPAHAPDAAPAGRSALVLWRDVPHAPAVDEAVARRTGARIGAVYAAGGRDAGEESVDWARAAEGLDSVVVLAEAWEAPDRGALRLLRRLREALGPRRHVVVLLAGSGPRAPAPADVRTWREGLARLEDPWLAVDALPEAT